MTTEALMDILWVLLCAGFVFLMQGGFLCLESGVTRSKNSVNVAFKNIVDFGLAVLLYWVVSYGLMFGESAGGWVGTSGFFFNISGDEAPFQYSVFIFQAMFCATGATIISGATAERLNFFAYLFITAVFSILVYPFVGHWVWATDFLGEASGWLGKQGFVDFAGSSVVHSTGGWVSLALLLLVGPRTGRFDDNGKPVTIPGSNMPLAMLGTTLLIFGWFGFNGGSTLSFNDSVPLILMNTLMGAVSGMVVVLALIPLTKQLPDPGLVMNGALAGLVAVTANCHITGPFAAVIIGGIGGIIMLGTIKLLEHLKIDDAVGAIPVHLTPGIWGTLAVAFFANPDIMGLESVNRTTLFQTQFIGVIVIGFWSFVLSFVFFYLIQKIFPFRVSKEDEAIGLNVSEHGVRTETLFLLEDMERHASTGDLSQRVRVEPFTEVGQIARQYNKVIDTLDLTMNRLKSVFRDLNDGIITFTQEGLITEINPAACKFFGLEPALASGMSAWDLLVPASREDLEVHQLADQDPFDPFRTGALQELHYTRKNSRKDEIVEFLASKGSYNNEIVFTGLIRDITETVQAKRNKRRLMSKLHGAQQSNFFAAMCRQSLPTVERLSERIKANSKATLEKQVSDTSNELSDPLKRLAEDAENIKNLTNDLSHLDKEGLLAVQTGDLSAFTKEVVLSLVDPDSDSELKEKMILGEFEDSSLAVSFAGNPLEQVIETLLTLAQRECREGQQVIITCKSAHLDHPLAENEIIPAGDYRMISIHDNGPGLNDEELDAFYDGIGKKHSDLDLALMDAMVRNMGGVLDIDSEINVGTTMNIYLPVFREIPQKELQSIETPEASVLVVDDYPTQRHWIAATLHEEHYQVYTAESGDEALTLLKSKEIDVVLLDLVLRKDSQPRDVVYHQIKEAHPDLPILVTCGQVDSHILASVIKEGAAGFIEKPIQPQLLTRLVKREVLTQQS